MSAEGAGGRGGGERAAGEALTSVAESVPLRPSHAVATPSKFTPSRSLAVMGHDCARAPAAASASAASAKMAVSFIAAALGGVGGLLAIAGGATRSQKWI